MANTYTQMHFQTVFAVKYREATIHPRWETELYQYITGVLQSYHHKMLQINGMPDHIHLVFGMRPTQSLSELMKQVKLYSSKWINEKGLVTGKFRWQEGYGAFTYSRSQVPQVIKYVEHQKAHHKKRSFREEYQDMLNRAAVEYDERYIFEELIPFESIRE